MDPESRFQLVSDRMTELQHERAMDRLAAASRRRTTPTSRPTGTPRTPRSRGILRRLAHAFAA
jgi:hypothetical protein